jgi:hypothetical protein
MSTTSIPAPVPAPIIYPPTAILTSAQVAAWLAVLPRQLARLGVPRVRLGHKTIRYRAKDVQAWLNKQPAIDKQAAKKGRRS